MAEQQITAGQAYGAYAQSFGTMPNETVYHDPYGLKGLKVDLKSTISDMYNEGQARLKAQTTTAGGAGTAGYALIPVFVDPKIVDQTRKYTPLVELVPRVTNQGMYADYNIITAKGGGFTAVEDAALAERDNTYDRQSTQIKFLYAVGRVTGPSVAAQPSYVMMGMLPQGGATGAFADQAAANALQQEVLVQTRAIRELEEDLIINGDASTDATEFSGIIKLMGATNTVDKNTTALAYADLNTAVRYAFDDGGRPNLAVCSSGVYEDLLNLLTAKIGYLQPTQKVFWGFETIVLHTMVGDIPVIPSMFMSNASGSKAIYFLDMTVVEMRVLQDLTYEDLAKTNDSRKFMLKIYEALIIKNVNFCSSITEISG
jgi:hypothetical protein